MSGMWKLTEIAQQLESGAYLQASAFEGKDYDAILDQRDRGDFEDDWVAAQEDIEAHWDEFAGADADIREVDRIRELAFKKCSSLTGGSELSSYVSDDFELMAKAAAIGLHSPYIQNMMNTYSDGGIPQ